MKALIDKYGGWNVTGSMADVKSLDILSRVANVSRDLNVKPLFRVSVGTDPHNSNAHIIQVKWPDSLLIIDLYL